MVASGKKQRPQALFVAPLMPSDGGNGLAMRTGFLLDAYAREFDVDLAVIPVAGGLTKITPYVVARTRRAAVLTLGPPDTQFSLVSSVANNEARLAAFRQYGRPSMAARLGAAMQQALMAWACPSYELVHVSRLYLSGLAAAWMHGESDAPYLVLDCDEDDASAYGRLARLHRKWGRHGRATWLEAEAEAFRALQGQWLRRFDLLLAASTGEARLLRDRVVGKVVKVVPNVVPANALRWSARRMQPDRRDIIFVGNMSYLPNIDAVMWFASRIWPTLRSTVPFPVRFVVLGAGSPPEVRGLARSPDIVVAGGVEDVGPHYGGAALVVVPIRAGGGTRIKLLESANYGVPIVATSFGAAGTGFRSGHELLLADGERDFAQACIKLLIDRKLACRLAQQARRMAHRDYDGQRRAGRFLAVIGACGRLGEKPA
jgi:glycosyltransferase involved in cell wall biosynthesis